MIEALLSDITHAPTPLNGERLDDAGVFSAPTAFAALVSNAATALETHGAAPTGESEITSIDPDSTNQRQRAGDPSTVQSETRSPSQFGPDTSQKAAPSNAGPQSALQAANIPVGITQNETSAPAALVHSMPIQTRAIASLPTAITATEGTAARRLTDNGPAPNAPVKAKAPAQSANAATFNSILAKKLHSGETHFQLRLDPPELGRVEARLHINEDGAAKLTLRFENQASMDMFARDQHTLQTALSDSNLSFNQSDIVFETADSAGDEGNAAAIDDTSPPPPTAYTAPIAARYFDFVY